MAENMDGRGGPEAVNSRRSSDVWPHFIVTRDGDGNDRATCKNCQTSLVANSKNGTSTLKRHLETESCMSMRQRRPRSALGRPSDERPPVPPPSINSALSETSLAYPALGSSRFNNQEECGAELAGMIAFYGYPSSIVENECFRRFVRGLNPHFQIPSRADVEGICHSRAEDAMNQLKAALAGCSGQISLATGTAETGQERALYMACQFIDDEWAFQKRIMQVFKVVLFAPENHSALQGAEEVCLQLPETIQKRFSIQSSISGKLGEAVRRWGLPGRLFSVAWGQQLEKCLERKDFLDGFCTFSCVSYTNNVLDSIACKFLEGLNPHVEADCLKAAKDLHLNHEKRARYFSELGLNHIGRYSHRWYSYYCALEVIQKESSENGGARMPEERQEVIQSQFEELITQQTFTELEDKIEKLSVQPRFQENEFTVLLRNILGAIYRAIETISSPSCPTSNLCLKELMEVRRVLQYEAYEARTVVAKAVAYALRGFSDGKNAHVLLKELQQDVLDNYLLKEEAYLHLSVSTILDPRFKLEYVETVLNEVCGPSRAPSYISKVKGKIDAIFKEHRWKLHSIVNNGEGTSQMTAGTTSTTEMDIDHNRQESITDMYCYPTGNLLPLEESDALDATMWWKGATMTPNALVFDDIINIPDLDTEGNTQEGTPNELKCYLAEARVPREEGEGFDVLMWWKANSSRYPTVASMARDALAMPASDMLSPEHIARIRSMMSSYCLTYP